MDVERCSASVSRQTIQNLSAGEISVSQPTQAGPIQGSQAIPEAAPHRLPLVPARTRMLRGWAAGTLIRAAHPC